MRVRRSVPALAVVLAVMGLPAVAHATAAPGETAPSPRLAGKVPTRQLLQSVATLSASDAWAVGYTRQSRRTSTLIEHWDGATWSVVASPDPGGRYVNRLYGVTALAADDVWAVGTFNHHASHYDDNHTLVLHWDGRSWQQVASPDGNQAIKNTLLGISGSAGDDVWAVGFYLQDAELGHRTLTLHWDGDRWSRVSTRGDGDLQPGFSTVAALAADDVWAAGPHGSVAHWDGAAWYGPLRGLSYSASLSASSPHDIWGVAESSAFHFDGKRWSREPEAGLSGLTGVTAIRPGDALAVGGRDAEHWDGTTWTLVDTAEVGMLRGVDASSSAEAWAVGHDGRSALLEHWDGTSFTRYDSDG